MDALQKRVDAEKLVHYNYGMAYGSAMARQSTLSSPEERKEAAAAIVAESFSTANRDVTQTTIKDISAGREAMQKAYGERANDVQNVLSGRLADYDLPKGFGGTQDMNALNNKAQILVSQVNMESFASRGRVEASGFNGNYLSTVQTQFSETKEKLVSHMLHVKSAIESGVDKNLYDQDQAKNLYERFEKTAFDTTSKSSTSQVYAEFEKSVSPALRREVSQEVEKRYELQTKIVARAKEKELDPANLAKANDFKQLSREDALKKHPDLATAYSALDSFKASAEKTFNGKPLEEVVNRAKDNLSKNIERGLMPKNLEQQAARTITEKKPEKSMER